MATVLHYLYIAVYWMFIYWIIAETLVAFIKGVIKGQSDNPWTGGNGCNFFNATDREPCCTAHDFDYKRGGWFIARFQADWRLFRCSLKEGAKIYPFVYFFGTRMISMWAFQWGRKRTPEEVYAIQKKQMLVKN